MLTHRPISAPRHLRHPGEWPALVLTLLVLLGLLVVVGTLSAGWLLVGGGGAWVALALHLRLRHARLLAQGVRVSETQLPHLAAALGRCAAALPLSRPAELVVVQSPALQAFAFGLGGTQTIVLTSGLVAALDDEALTAVVAHEWSHLALGHTVMGSLVGALTRAGVAARQLAGLRGVPLARPRSAAGSWQPLVISAATLLVPLIFLAHRRYAEYSADRGALLVVGEVAPLVRALAVLAVGAPLAAHLCEEELVAQATSLTRSPFGLLHLLEHGHPFLGGRIQALRAWHGSPHFQALVAARHPTKGEDA